jgi:hypothetical protein
MNREALKEATATASIAHRRRGIWLVYYHDDQADAEVWDAFGSLRAAKAWVEEDESGEGLVWKWEEHAPGAWMGTSYSKSTPA